MERRVRLRKMLAEMDEDEKVEKLGEPQLAKEAGAWSCMYGHPRCSTLEL